MHGPAGLRAEKQETETRVAGRAGLELSDLPTLQLTCSLADGAHHCVTVNFHIGRITFKLNRIQ